MYMDENDVRSPRDRVDGELLRRLLGENGRTDGCGCEDAESDRGVRENTCRQGCSRAAAENERGRAAISVGASACTLPANRPCGRAESTDCGWEDHRPCPKNGLTEYALAMVYAPIQEFRELYDPQTGLSRGTVFRELDLPFRGDGKRCGGGNCHGC